jgi:hypothetical protein
MGEVGALGLGRKRLKLLFVELFDDVHCRLPLIFSMERFASPCGMTARSWFCTDYCMRLLARP